MHAVDVQSDYVILSGAQRIANERQRKIIKINHFHSTKRETVCPYEMFFLKKILSLLIFIKFSCIFFRPAGRPRATKANWSTTRVPSSACTWG